MINFDDISKGVEITDYETFNASAICITCLLSGREFPYESMKILSDNHETGCHCSVCDWIDNKDYDDLILHPKSEPVYVY